MSPHPPEGFCFDQTLGAKHLESSIITLVPHWLFYPLGVSYAFSVPPPSLLNCFLFFFSSSFCFSLALPSCLLYPCLSLLPQFGSYHWSLPHHPHPLLSSVSSPIELGFPAQKLGPAAADSGESPWLGTGNCTLSSRQLKPVACLGVALWLEGIFAGLKPPNLCHLQGVAAKRKLT